ESCRPRRAWRSRSTSGPDLSRFSTRSTVFALLAGGRSRTAGTTARTTSGDDLRIDLVEFLEVAADWLEELAAAFADGAVEAHHLRRIANDARHDLGQLLSGARAVQPAGLARDRVIGVPADRIGDDRN